MSISFGGDPENYMDPPQMTHSQVGDGGPSFVALLFELLGIHRNVARGPQEQKESKVKTAAAQTLKEQSKTPAAQSWIDSPGAALSRDHMMKHSGALPPIEQIGRA